MKVPRHLPSSIKFVSKNNRENEEVHLEYLDHQSYNSSSLGHVH